MTRRRLLFWLKGAYLLAVISVLAWAVWTSRRDIIAWQYAGIGWGQVFFVVSWMFMAGLLGIAWARLVRVYLGLRLPVATWLPLQGAAWAGRYVPGKLGLLAGRLALLPRAELSARTLTFTVFAEQLAFLAAGAALGLFASFPLVRWDLDLMRWSTVRTAWPQLRVVLAAALCPLLFLALNVIARRLTVVSRATWRDAAELVALYLFAHFLPGLALFYLLTTMPLHVTPDVLQVVALLAAANVVGILAIFAPAGVGVREAVLTAGLAPYLALGDALALAALLRLLTLIADGLFVLTTGGIALLRRFRRSQDEG